MEQEGLKKERAFNMAESFLLQLSVFSSLKMMKDAWFLNYKERFIVHWTV